MSRTKIDERKVRERVLPRLFRAVTALKTPQKAKEFLNLLLTPTEKERVARRLSILKSLRQGATYREIRQSLGATDNSIAEMSNLLKEASESPLETIDKLIREDLLEKDKSLQFLNHRKTSS